MLALDDSQIFDAPLSFKFFYIHVCEHLGGFNDLLRKSLVTSSLFNPFLSCFIVSHEWGRMKDTGISHVKHHSYLYFMLRFIGNGTQQLLINILYFLCLISLCKCYNVWESERFTFILSLINMLAHKPQVVPLAILTI